MKKVNDLEIMSKNPNDRFSRDSANMHVILPFRLP